MPANTSSPKTLPIAGRNPLAAPPPSILANNPQGRAVAVRPKALDILGNFLQIDAKQLYSILKNQLLPGASDDEIAAFVTVCNVYRLNPVLREIHGFVDPRRKRVVPVVGVDGWATMVNRMEDYDGCEFEWFFDEKNGLPIACTCKLFHKKRTHPIQVTEYFDECKRETDPWRNMPKRMLRHKAFIQASRLAFGFSGVYDEDEARDIVGVAEIAALPSPPPEFSGPQEPVSEPPHEQTEEPRVGSREDDATEPEPPQEAQPPEDITEGKSNEEVLGMLKAKMQLAKISDDQLTAYLRGIPLEKGSKKRMCASDQHWNELASSKLRWLVNLWDRLLPEVKTVDV